jgi:hypothetical protein
MFLIKNLFNIIKFELKIYNFILNNVIKIVYIIFCRVELIGPTIGPSRAWPKQAVPCLARRTGGEARARSSASLGLTRPTIFYAEPCSCRANFIVLRTDPFSPA